MLETFVLALTPCLAASATPPQDTPERDLFVRRFLPRAEKLGLQDDGAGKGPPAEVELAKLRALLWLADHQAADGTWAGGPGTTGLVLLALVASGNGPDRGPLKLASERALEALLARPAPEDPRDRALVGIALIETLEVAPDARVRRAVEGLVADLVDGAHPGGGWDGRTRPEGAEIDRGATAWALLVLRGAEEVGIAVDSGVVVRALDALQRVDAPRSLEEAALELAARVAAGQSEAVHAPIQRAAGELVALAAEPDALSDAEALLGSVALRELGGDRWHAWRDALRASWLAGQEEDGSWGGAGRARVERAATRALCLGLEDLRSPSRVVFGIRGSEPGPVGVAPIGIVGERADDLEVDAALALALDWLAARQRDDGGWDADDPALDGPGQATADVGVTGLALLALLEGGGADGPHAPRIRRAADWLSSRQDADSGLIGARVGHAFHYDHAIATQALARYRRRSDHFVVHERLERAVRYILRARNPYGAWRYDSPPIGDNDTSVTGWMVGALLAARETGARVDEQALDDALRWIAEVTDEETGRVGYDAPGSLSSRIHGVNTDFAPEHGEGMTAVGLVTRLAVDRAFLQDDLCERQVALLLARPPRWEPWSGCDMNYWLHGTRALHAVGGDAWESWWFDLRDAVLPAQRRDGEHAGSWDPVGPWGALGGRVYSTAMIARALATPNRAQDR